MAEVIDIWEDLRKPFEDDEIEWRVQQGGIGKNDKPWVMVIPYIDARAVMTRLDQAVGTHFWQDEYEHLNGGVKCRLSIWDGRRGLWITKEDGSPDTDIEAFKGGFSKALVRCAVKWGIGRYLYKTPTVFADITDAKGQGIESSKIKDKKTGKELWVNWKHPKLSQILKPTNTQQKLEQTKPNHQNPTDSSSQRSKLSQTGFVEPTVESKSVMKRKAIQQATAPDKQTKEEPESQPKKDQSQPTSTLPNYAPPKDVVLPSHLAAFKVVVRDSNYSNTQVTQAIKYLTKKSKLSDLNVKEFITVFNFIKERPREEGVND